MTRRFLLALLLLASPAWAATESIQPTGENDSASIGDGSGTGCATTCDGQNCALLIDEDPDSPSGTKGDSISSVSASSDVQLYTMEDPALNPTTGADEQTIKVAVDITDRDPSTACNDILAGGSAPDYDINLFCNGVDKGAIVTDQSVTGTATNSHTFTYTPDADCDAAGANVQIQFGHDGSAGSAANRRSVRLDALEWVANTAATGRRRPMTIGPGG
jgi:hypothetical protein